MVTLLRKQVLLLSTNHSTCSLHYIYLYTNELTKEANQPGIWFDFCCLFCVCGSAHWSQHMKRQVHHFVWQHTLLLLTWQEAKMLIKYQVPPNYFKLQATKTTDKLWLSNIKVLAFFWSYASSEWTIQVMQKRCRVIPPPQKNISKQESQMQV